MNTDLILRYLRSKIRKKADLVEDKIPPEQLPVLVDPDNNFADDAAAAAGEIAIGGLYHTNGTVKIRVV